MLFLLQVLPCVIRIFPRPWKNVRDDAVIMMIRRRQKQQEALIKFGQTANTAFQLKV